MVRRISEPLNNFTGIGAGQTATLDVPIGPTYDAIILKYSDNGTPANEATMKARITEVRVNINGVTQRRLSATDIIDIAKRHGRDFVDGQLPLYFMEPWKENPIGQDILAWGTDGLQSFNVEVDIASAATAPVLKAQSFKRQVRQPLGAIKKFIKKTVPITAVGENTINLDVLDTLEVVHCRTTDISKIKVKTDGLDVLQVDASDNALLQTVFGKEKETVTGIFSIDFNLLDRIEDNLPMTLPAGNGQQVRIQDFLVVFDMAAATSFEIIEERIGLAS